MDYHEMTRRVRKLDFIRNEHTADAAIRAILGLLASRLSEEHAHQLAGKFPEHLIEGRFGGDEKNITAASVHDSMGTICAQFKISMHQARTLVRNVLYFTKEATGDGMILEIKKNLPVDWAEAIQNA